MNSSPLEKRIARRERNTASLDLNLVALIDIFTILIFFLLSNMTEVQNLPNSSNLTLPQSTAERSPRETLVVLVNDTEIVVDGRRIAAVADVLRTEEDLIAPLKAELELLASRRVVRAENAATSQAVTIMGDKDIPYRLLRKVMSTCAQANFTEVAFAVRHKQEQS